MKNIIKLTLTLLTLTLSSFAQAKLKVLTYDEFTANFKIGKSYPVILEGYNIPGLLDRTGQFFCGAIAFTKDSTESKLFYTFKAWAPESGKCNFQSSTNVGSLAAVHTCVASQYSLTRSFSKKEIKDTLPGNRAMEIESTDDNFYVLSRCNGTIDDPSYITLAAAGTSLRDPDKNIRVLKMENESRSFDVLEDTSADVDVLTIQLNNAFNYVLIKDAKIN